MSEQQKFWANDYAQEYIKKNSSFNQRLGQSCWEKILANASEINSILECGCNIGRNISFLNNVLPNSKNSIIELSEPAYDFVKQNFDIDQSFNGAIIDSNLQSTFDLVFTMGVLIHIHPDDLYANIKKMFDYSEKYILIGEYFNRTPVMIEYQGQIDKLFKRDFGKFLIENFDVKLVDYGFLWGHVYDDAGFDDITWWLFQK